MAPGIYQERGKNMDLQGFFRENPEAALAFSGGVDSAYLLYAGLAAGARIRAYYVKSAFQPAFEFADARRLAKELGADIRILEVDVLDNDTVADNPADRCYYCKRTIFSKILTAAEEDGFHLVLDGTNASDDAGDRPGMRALKEMSVRSPLRECGLTKDRIRALSRQAGLFTWNKPAYACLATRVPSGTRITQEILEKTERAEEYLFSLGFSDFRVRYLDGCARLQFPAAQLEKVLENREKILKTLGEDYDQVLLDLRVRPQQEAVI